jgi:hypothetical protein
MKTTVKRFLLLSTAIAALLSLAAYVAGGGDSYGLEPLVPVFLAAALATAAITAFKDIYGLGSIAASAFSALGAGFFMSARFVYFSNLYYNISPEPPNNAITVSVIFMAIALVASIASAFAKIPAEATEAVALPKRMKLIPIVSLAAIVIVIAGGFVVNAQNSASPPSSKSGNALFTFTGDITIDGEHYAVALEGSNDGGFSLAAGNVPPIIGKYEFFEGKGYLFSFDDAKDTQLLTSYDSAAKTLSLVYPLDLGPRGKGNVKISLKDDKFAYDGEGWTFGLPVFTGIANFMDILLVNLELQCRNDGTFTVHNDSSYAQQIDGTYSFENGVYKFDVSDGFKFESTLDPATGLHSVTFMIGVNNVPVETTLVERALVAD